MPDESGWVDMMQPVHDVLRESNTSRSIPELETIDPSKALEEYESYGQGGLDALLAALDAEATVRHSPFSICFVLWYYMPVLYFLLYTDSPFILVGYPVPSIFYCAFFIDQSLILKYQTYFPHHIIVTLHSDENLYSWSNIDRRQFQLDTTACPPKSFTYNMEFTVWTYVQQIFWLL